MNIGIDFGTTFSQMATAYLGQLKLLLKAGQYGVPSEFYYDKENGILIGEDAWDAGQGSCAANLVSEVKMAIVEGRSYTLDGKTFTAKEIIKNIYQYLITQAIQNAKKYVSDPALEGVVISIPAKFGMQERQFIYEAARDCLQVNGTKITAIIKEPVAAALYYYHINQLNQCSHNILVYDLGGGTCDVALVCADEEKAEHYIVADSDMVRRGGRDWDKELIAYIGEKFKSKAGILPTDDGFREKLRRTALDVKHALSDDTKDRAFARVEHNGRLYTIPVTRKIFDEITKYLLDETIECLRDLYDRNQYQYSIDEIICVGGSSNMLQVREALESNFPECNVRLFEPEHAVVYGATLYSDLQKTALSDKTNLSYGVDTYRNFPDEKTHIVENLIKKGSDLPASGESYFYPVENNQERVRFRIYESESEDATYSFSSPDKTYIGDVVLDLPKNANTSLKITCEVQLDSDGLLKIDATEPSGKKVHAEFQIANL